MAVTEDRVGDTSGVAIEEVTSGREMGPLQKLLSSQPFWVTVAVLIWTAPLR